MNQPDRIIWSPPTPEDLERLQRVQRNAVVFGTGMFRISQKGDAYEFAEVQPADIWLPRVSEEAEEAGKRVGYDSPFCLEERS